VTPGQILRPFVYRRNSTSYTYGDAEQMLTAGGVSYQYDERGNQKQRGSDTFTWDHENRMTGLTIGSTTASYAYNGDGLRMSSTVGANTTSYVWDVAAGLPVVLAALPGDLRAPSQGSYAP
jgi:hypothetical protein